MANGFILWQGPSLFTQEPVVAILTGLDRPSSNKKTGPMSQSYIIRQDMHPWEAVDTRSDASICGGCRFRKQRDGSRLCYVNIMQQGVAAVFDAYQKGKYRLASDLAELGRNRIIRVGAYGDPGAVPSEVWSQLLRQAHGWTGYTHAWRKRPDLKQWLQASVDSESEFFEAAALGWGTYRVRLPDAPLLTSESSCPASKEEGHRETCYTCLKCAGGNHISILVHGSSARKFKALPILQEA